MSQTPGDVVNSLESALGLQQGEGRPLYQRLVPVVVVANTRDPFDSDAQVRRAAGGGANDPAVAAEFSSVSLLNPPGSGVDVQVNKVVVSPAVAQQNIVLGIVLAAVIAGSSNTQQANFLDTRLAGTPAATIEILTAAAINVATVGLYGFGVAVNIEVEIGVMLRPGTALILRGDAVQEEVIGSFTWFEQPRSIL